ncbi:MAG: hypothetical protein AB7O97_15360 [Planctomycetota bacterium]
MSRLPIAFVLFSSLLPSQVHPGQATPALELTWKGPAPDGGAGGSRVIAFHRSLANAALDADVLHQLQRRFGADGLQVVLVVPTPADGDAVPAALQGIPLGIDADGANRQRWLGNQLDFYVALCAADTVRWVGRPAHGMVAAVGAALQGGLEPATSAEQWRRRLQLLGEFGDGEGARMLQLARELLQDCPTDGPSWGLCYLTQVQKLGDAAAAAETVAAALAALPAEPRALAAFADLALRGDPLERTLPPRLVEPLTAAAKAFPADLRVQLTLLRALVRADDGRRVGILSHQLAAKVRSVPNAALEFVEILTQAAVPEIHVDLGSRALETARNGGADLRSWTAARYQFTLKCRGDREAARDIAVGYMDQAPGRVTLNNDAWYFMTDLPTCGRFDAFALALVERMLEQRSAMEGFEFDTAALAMYRNGRLDEAVELQQLAIERGGEAPNYKERLARYRAAAGRATAPR